MWRFSVIKNVWVILDWIFYTVGLPFRYNIYIQYVDSCDKIFKSLIF